jgi:heptosyltransferase-2
VLVITDLLKHKSKVFDFSECSLEKTVALIKRCHLFISNDSGLLKFADGLGKKIVALYGPIDEKVYGPYLSDNRSIILKKDLPCRPCYNNFRLQACSRDRECLKSISVEEVFEAAVKLLN